MKFIAHNYQIKTAQKGFRTPYLAIYADPGTGKTAITLMIISELKRTGKLPGPVLLLTTKNIQTNVWPAEIAKWDQFNHLKYIAVRGSNKEQLLNTEADIYCVTNESLKWLIKQPECRKFKMLIIDESSKYKSWSAVRTKMIRQAVRAGVFERRLILTGSPTPKNMLDIFPQQYIVDAGRTLGSYITHFRQAYFIDKGYQYPDWQLRPGADEEIYKSIAPYSVRLERSLLNLPPLVVNDIVVEVPEKVRKLSEQEVKGISLMQNLNASTNYTFARQVAGGFTTEGEILHTSKIDALADLIDELNSEPLLVFYHFREEGRRLAERFKAPRIDGGSKTPEVQKAIVEWNGGRLPVLLANPAATGHGLNLQAGGTNLCYYSLTDNYDDYYQSYQRVWRQGVKGAVTLHRILARGTIDRALVRGLDEKESGQKAFLDAIRELQEEV